MKKLNIVILILFIILICTGIYKLFFHEINEEFEVLNKDVSSNNIKSVMEVELEDNENIDEIPLGYKNDKVYILRYIYEDTQNKVGKYDKTIYEIDENGVLTDSEMSMPEKYCTSNELSIYGNYIFCGGSYYDWTTGEETIIFSDESQYRISAVSGNKDYILYEKNEDEKNKYYLVNIKSSNIYEYKASNDIDNVIKDVFFDRDTSEFYGINYNDNIIKLNLNDNSFSTEVYDNELKLNYSNEDMDKENIEDRYICSDNGKVYFNSSKIHGSVDGFNINGYYVRDKHIEGIDGISVCGYDKFNSDCLLVKKKDDTLDRMYFAKFKNNNMDILMAIPKAYGNESSIAIRMSDDANLLVSEIYHDSINNKVKNKFAVYDLKEYFNDNEYVLNNEGTWTGKKDEAVNLINTYKNIDDSQRENKETINEKTDEIPKVDINDNTKMENKNTYEESNNKESNNKKYNNKKSNNTELFELDDFSEDGYKWEMKNGNWYYVDDKNQKFITGWICNRGKWFYLDKNGALLTDQIVIENGKEYVLGKDGAWIDSDNDNQQYLEDKSKEENIDKGKKLIDRNKEENLKLNKNEIAEEDDDRDEEDDYEDEEYEINK